MKRRLNALSAEVTVALAAACIAGLSSVPAHADPYATYAVLQMNCATWQTLDYPKVVEYAVLGEWTGLNIAATVAGTGGTGGLRLSEPEQIAALRMSCSQTPTDEMSMAAARVWTMMNSPQQQTSAGVVPDGQ